MKNRKIALVLKGYPRLSETFIAQEIHSLEKRGFDITIVSLRQPTSRKRHPVHDAIRAPLLYLPEYLYQEPSRVLKGWLRARRMPGYRQAFRHWLSDLRRDFTANRVRRFGQAVVLAAEFPAGCRLIYSHFIHTPSSVARYASDILELPWTASAHAKDIWTTPDWELAEKIESMDWLVTCTSNGHEHLQKLADNPEKIRLVYHGLDLSKFSARKSLPLGRDGSNPEKPLRLLTVARPVEKKGLDTLARALADLPEDLHWHWTQVGTGEDSEKLKALVDSLGISRHVSFKGAMAQSEVIAEYHDADLFVLPCRIAASGDRDGLPNVIVEAQSQGLMVISTGVSGVPELVTDGKNGLLVPPDDPAALAEAVSSAGRNPAMRRRMGMEGAKIVRSSFEHDATIEPLEHYLVQSLDSSP